MVRSLPFQQSNHSVRVEDAFMVAASEGGDWSLRAVTTGEVVDTLPARELLRECAQPAWECGDPGLLFAGAIDAWHTCPASGSITASGPCAEFLHASACNLATLNLLGFLSEDGSFDVEGCVQAVETTVLAQDVVVCEPCSGAALRRLGYPSETTAALARAAARRGSLAGEARLRPEHRRGFQTAVGDEAVSAAAQVQVVAAVQPFLSGGVSKDRPAPRRQRRGGRASVRRRLAGRPSSRSPCAGRDRSCSSR